MQLSCQFIMGYLILFWEGFKKILFYLHSFDATNSRQQILTAIIMSFLFKLWVSFNSYF